MNVGKTSVNYSENFELTQISRTEINSLLTLINMTESLWSTNYPELAEFKRVLNDILYNAQPPK